MLIAQPEEAAAVLNALIVLNWAVFSVEGVDSPLKAIQTVFFCSWLPLGCPSGRAGICFEWSGNAKLGLLCLILK